ncbi:CLUMA_CG014886, isoform A [Clunio marinus]|uniref:CLUMA_CG014886, isoform A n=1 Tax=Clunio marinus TaxID=568069 RepID=A0A1J1IPM5_9DIPT|nr:CLUMA_CG014886, isoform A [Clunio marinus]
MKRSLEIRNQKITLGICYLMKGLTAFYFNKQYRNIVNGQQNNNFSHLSTKSEGIRHKIENGYQNRVLTYQDQI